MSIYRQKLNTRVLHSRIIETHDQFFLDPQTPQNPTQKRFIPPSLPYRFFVMIAGKGERFLGWVLRGLGVQEELVVSITELANLA